MPPYTVRCGGGELTDLSRETFLNTTCFGLMVTSGCRPAEDTTPTTQEPVKQTSGVIHHCSSSFYLLAVISPM